ncbi:hypothetical protein PRNP1_013174 [Phytophthora ramorum]
MERAPADSAAAMSSSAPPDSLASPSSPYQSSEPSADALHLRLKTLDERVFDVEAASSMSVADFRAKVALATAVPVPRQRLIYRGKLLKDGAALAAYDLQDGHTVHLVAKPPTRAANPAASSNATQTNVAEQEEDAPGAVRRWTGREGDGPAWNLASLRSALRRTATAAPQPLPMLREILDEMGESPQEAADAMGLGGNRNAAQATPDLEPITQGLLTMRTVLSTAALEQETGRVNELQVQTGEEEMMVLRGPRQFFVGQWLDVKDTVNQWLESTVMAIADGKVLVHYHGWPTRWDEWIDFDSERIAAFRTRTLHTQNAQRMSPVPTTRVPSAPRVSDNDVRRMVGDVRNLMREMMPHIDRLAELCEEDLRREERNQRPPSEPEPIHGLFEEFADLSRPITTEEGEETRGSEVSEVAHMVAPLFDRFGRLLMDSVRYLDPLLRPELRDTSQRQQERRSAVLRHGPRGSTRQQASSVSASMEAQDNSLSIRDLITTSPNTPSEANQPRRSIDVHIHAIVAPASLSSLASLTRGNNDAGNNGDTGVTDQRARMPSTPPTRRSFGFDDSRNSNPDDDADHSRVPLLGSYRHRSHSQASEPNPQQRSVARDLDAFLSDDFFGSSFSHDGDNDDSDEDSSMRYTHSDAMQGGRLAYRPPSPSTQISSPRTLQSGDSSQYSSSTIGVIPEVAEAEERIRARASEHTPSQLHGDDHSGETARASSASAESSSSGSSGFPTFLEVMRRTLSGVRNLVHNETNNSPTEEASQPVELVSDFSLPSSSSSSPSSLASSSSSTAAHWSRDNSSSRSRSPSHSNSIEEDLDLDEVD